MITKNYKKKNGLKLKGDNTMKKNFKRVSAIILAAAMSMSSSVIASAAKMNIYVREYEDSSKSITVKYPKDASSPTIVLDTTPGESIYEAIDAGNVATDSIYNVATASITSDWTTVTNKDGSTDSYLLSLGISNGTDKTFDVKTNVNNYSDMVYENGNAIHGKWDGYSWMWLEGGAEKIDSLVYPGYTMSDVKCPATDFSIILSYDHSSMTW